MGRGLADLADARRFPYHFVDAPGMVQLAHARRREELRSRSRRRSCARCARAPRRALGGAARRRGRHGARVLRRRAAPGDQGRGAARRPERAAPAERADRRGDRLRPRQRRRRHLRGLRPGRRHLRHLDPAAVARRVRGARDQRRLGARRRRLRPSRVLLDHRGGEAAAAVAGGHAPAAGEGARGEGEPDRARRGADRRRRSPTAQQVDLDARRTATFTEITAQPGAKTLRRCKRALRDAQLRAGRHQGRGDGRRRDAHAADPARGRPSSSASRRSPISIRTRSWRSARRSRPTCSPATARAATTGCCST